MKKIFAFLICIAAAVSMCGCGGVKEVTAGALSGSWESEAVDASGLIRAAFNDDADMRELVNYVDFGAFEFSFDLSLSPDGSFTLTPSELSLNAAEDGFVANLTAGFREYLLAEAVAAIGDAGYTEDEYRSALGISESDDLLTALGIDVDAFFSQLDMRGGFSGLADEMTVNGSFTFSGTALSFSSGGSEEAAEYDPAADTICFTGGNDGGFDGLYPIVFHRAD